jgi:hypothetical protein
MSTSTRVFIAFAFAIVFIAMGARPTLAMGKDWGFEEYFERPAPCTKCGAPGPIAGAGLPVLAVGYGAYWLVRRLRRSRKPD